MSWLKKRAESAAKEISDEEVPWGTIAPVIEMVAREFAKRAVLQVAPAHDYVDEAIEAADREP